MSEISDKGKCKQKSHSSGSMFSTSVGKRDAASRGNAPKLSAMDSHKRFGCPQLGPNTKGDTEEITHLRSGLKTVFASIFQTNSHIVGSLYSGTPLLN